MCSYRGQLGWNLGSQAFAYEDALQRLNQYPRRAISLQHRWCGSRHCWEEGGRNQYSDILMALAWGWWIYTSDGYINRRYNHCVNRECCHRRSARPQPHNSTAWHCWDKPNWDGGLYILNVIPIVVSNTAAGWVKAAMIFRNPTLVRVVHLGLQTNSTPGAQTPMCGGRSYLPLDDILPTPAEDRINDIGVESDDEGETPHPNPRSLPTTKTGFQNIWTQASKYNVQTPAIPWSHPKPCSLSLYRLWVKPCCWWGCSLATRARSHCESTRCRLFGQ